MIGVVQCSDRDVLAERLDNLEAEEEPTFAQSGVDPINLYKPAAPYVTHVKFVAVLLLIPPDPREFGVDTSSAESGRPKPSKGFFSNLFEHVLGGS